MEVFPLYFIDGIISLADRLNMTPDDVYIIGIFVIIFYWEMLGWLLLLVTRFIRWCYRLVRRWLRSRRTDCDN